jgi:hypothetical protein
MPQANFRLLHAAGDASVAGKVKSDHGNLGMYRSRPEKSDPCAGEILQPSGAPTAMTASNRLISHARQGS